LVCLGVWYWLKARELKDIAYKYAALQCRDLDLTVLDQTVALQKLALRRDARGKLGIYREYGFDFSSSGEDRYKGLVKMMGPRLQGVHLAPHKVD
jgi:hypothetical protein